ncbi:hypothetical protein CHUAL_013065 [Chamberlinius hualienensis]
MSSQNDCHNNHEEDTQMSVEIKIQHFSELFLDNPKLLHCSKSTQNTDELTLTGNKSKKSKFNHLKPFIRAFSFETHDAMIKNLTFGKSGHDRELGRTVLETKTDLDTIKCEPNGPDKMIKTFQCDSGIVCSDEDLRLILSSKVTTEITNCTSAAVRREKMKSNRSLSLDSSFFKLRIRHLKNDISKLINQKNEKIVDYALDKPSLDSPNISDILNGIGNNSVSTSSEADQSNFDVTEKPLLFSEDFIPLDNDELCLTEHTIGNNLDDKTSLLVDYISECSQNHSNTNSKQPNTSKVLWTKESEIDVDILGHAIEFYLTSTLKSSTSISNIHYSCNDSNHGRSRNSVPNTFSPVISTLKGLFVK